MVANQERKSVMPKEKKKRKQLFTLTTEERQEIEKENEQHKVKDDIANQVMEQIDKKFKNK